jgi:hypothetical protein
MELEVIQNNILEIRGQRVILDANLAELYEVEIRTLNQAVKRNKDRFPSDFMFQLNMNEWQNLKSQFVIPSWGGRRTFPYAFTEQGVVMLSGVLRSKKAIKVNIEIMRAFVMLRKIALEYADITKKIEFLEEKYDSQFAEIFTVIKYLLEPPKTKRNKIGYKK